MGIRSVGCKGWPQVWQWERPVRMLSPDWRREVRQVRKLAMVVPRRVWSVMIWGVGRVCMVLSPRGVTFFGGMVWG